MSSFKFRLEKVWKHRRTVVDEHSVAVARTNRQVAKLSRQVVELDRTIARQARALIPAAGESLHPRDLVSGSEGPGEVAITADSLMAGPRNPVSAS
jgi:hypothetical protein